MNYKKTLDIPFTEFSMKANLVSNSEKYSSFWKDHQIFNKRQALNKDSEPFIVHDGPPYANGSIHIGHALNKILKDFIVRTRSFQGFYTHFVPGWDCHGLPIENQIEKKSRSSYKALSKPEKRLACAKYSDEQIQQQIKQYTQLGLFIDFETKYKTSDKSYISLELDVFLELCKKELLYWELKPVFWSWSSKTTLAESEIIYQSLIEDSIYWTFAVVKAPQSDSRKESFFVDANLLIWTTTPYTLEANLAVAIAPDKTYCLFQFKDKKYICIQSQYLNLINKFGWDKVGDAGGPKVLQEFQGKELVGHSFLNSLTNDINPVLEADFIDDETGTGLVHVAPGFGLDDYKLALKHNIDIYCSVTEDGTFQEDTKFKPLSKVFYTDGSLVVIDYLKSLGTLVLKEPIEHNVGHDWRTKKPTLFRATKQWFLNLKKVKDQIESSFEGLETSPKWLGEKLKNTILQREEWCLSRQRSWGVFMPILFLDDEPLLEIQQIEHVCSIFKNEGLDAWLSNDVDYFLSEKTKSKLSAEEKSRVRKSMDILDVWFDSGCSFLSLSALQGISNQQSKPPVANIYLEGFDQLRGWFNSSSIISNICASQLPFKTLIGHGFVLDGNGNKMSKSLGNVVDPIEVIKKNGSDILRLWVAQSNYFEDIRFNDQSLQNAVTQYRKIRNVLFKFSLSILKDHKVDLSILGNLKSKEVIYIYNLFNTEFNQALKYIDSYNFSKALLSVLNFLNTYSSWYLEISKSTLYSGQIDQIEKQECLAIVYTVLHKCLVFFSVFLPQTCEEAYSHFNKLDAVGNKADKKESIFLESWPQLYEFKDSPETAIDSEYWDELFRLREQVYSAIEEAKNQKTITLISDSKVTISANLLKKLTDTEEIRKLLNVAEVIVCSLTQTTISVEKTSLQQCQRCKRYLESANYSGSVRSDLCYKCDKIVEEYTSLNGPLED